MMKQGFKFLWSLKNDGEECSAASTISHPNHLCLHSMEAVPLHGTSSSLLWPLVGVTAGAALGLAFERMLTPAKREAWAAFARKHAKVAAALAGVWMLSRVRLTPETGRPRIEARWPWINPEDIVEDFDADEFFAGNTLMEHDEKSIWTRKVMRKLEIGNLDISDFRYRDKHFKTKIISDVYKTLICFMAFKTRTIWLSDHYLRLVQDDAQMGYVFGHETSHVILAHETDFCFMEFSRDVALVSVGFYVGWRYGVPILMKAPTLLWERLFFGVFASLVAMVNCYALATLVNIVYVLPYRRLLEREADVIGLKLAAKACFPLNTIPHHWGMMQFANLTPSWRSTHPSALGREQHLTSLLPWAFDIRAGSACGLP